MDNVFSYRTRGNSSPENKSKVYFTCHPNDFERCFDQICNDILDVNDCVIFYREDMGSFDSDENTYIDLERMSLFVIPVTLDLLTTHNRALDFDYRFAQEKNIPVLPLMMESDAYEYYKRPDNFGELQYLNPNSTDLSAIDYKEKLNRYLESVLLSDEMVQKIRNEFDAYIFLSYRKTDRKYANELMKLIHQIDECEDVAIWFDEFLTPGVSYRENIDKYLKGSELFALLVTPRILENDANGAPNFVIREEYPKAVKLNKRIIPIEMELTDKRTLSRCFPGIPGCSDLVDIDAFNNRILSALAGIATSENNDDPSHNYLIGLAYLNGIDVEIDKERGVKLITKAAEAGLWGAIEKIHQMYLDGDTVNFDYKKALYWAKKQYENCAAKYGEDNPHTLTALDELAVAQGINGDYKTSVELQEKCYEARCRKFGEKDQATLSSLSNLSYAYMELGEVKKALELNEKCYEIKAETMGEENIRTLASLNNLAIAYMEYGDIDKSFELQSKCYEIRHRVLGEIHIDTLRSLCNLAILYLKKGDYQKALQLSEKCYGLMCKNLGEERPDTTLNALETLANAHACLGNFIKAGELFRKCYEIKCRVLGKEHPDTLKTLEKISRLNKVNTSGVLTFRSKPAVPAAKPVIKPIPKPVVKTYSVEELKSKLLIIRNKLDYRNLKFCEPSDPEVLKAIAKYASGASPKDVFAIDDRTGKIIKTPKGILFTKDALYGSMLEGTNRISYRDIKSVSIYAEGVRFKMKDGKVIECDFNPANDLILNYLHDIGIG